MLCARCREKSITGVTVTWLFILGLTVIAYKFEPDDDGPLYRISIGGIALMHILLSGITLRYAGTLNRIFLDRQKVCFGAHPRPSVFCAHARAPTRALLRFAHTQAIMEKHHTKKRTRRASVKPRLTAAHHAAHDYSDLKEKLKELNTTQVRGDWIDGSCSVHEQDGTGETPYPHMPRSVP